MKVRFQADADLHQMIVMAFVRRKPGVDFRTATAAGLAGLLDPQVLERATTGRARVGFARSVHDDTTLRCLHPTPAKRWAAHRPATSAACDRG